MIKLLIIGAGSAGRMVADEIIEKSRLSQKYKIIGFVDDDPAKTMVMDIPVFGSIKDAGEIIESRNINEVIVAIPSASRALITEIITLIGRVPVKTKIVPLLHEIIEGNVYFNQIREIEPADLLGREEVGFDADKISSFYRDKTVFVTGAGGSIGSEIFLQLFELPVGKVVAFGHGENSIHSLATRVRHDKRFDYVIGDIRDKNKLSYEISRMQPDIMFHAAAHKHVPLMEDYPDEAIKNNVIGTYNAATSAAANSVKHFILVSTDKAVNPSSVMGASKRVAERIILSLDNLQDKTSFSLTRFGNVLGSRGSVIPIFKEQILLGGPVTVTHPEMTRFFMSIREAARLVIKSATIKDGKIFVLDMGTPIKIIDLAKNLIKLYGYDEDEVPIEYTGLRPGEKMYEEVLSKSEDLSKSTYEKLFISNEVQNLLSQPELEKMIEDFKSSANKHDRENIINLFKSYVPEYKRPAQEL